MLITSLVPRKKGEGCYRALAAMGTNEAQELAFVSAHGTATPYNDEMEAKALHRAELQDVPVNALKGIYGHTWALLACSKPFSR